MIPRICRVGVLGEDKYFYSIYHNLQQVKIDLSQFEHPIYKIHKFNKGLITLTLPYELIKSYFFFFFFNLHLW